MIVAVNGLYNAITFLFSYNFLFEDGSSLKYSNFNS